MKKDKKKNSAIEAFRKYQLLERKFAKALKHPSKAILSTKQIEWVQTEHEM